MESFTIELVSNACAQLVPDKTLSFFTKFFPEHLNLKGKREVAFPDISYPSMYEKVIAEKFMFSDTKLSSWSK